MNPPPASLIAVGAGLGGMLGWGFADFFAKIAIDEVGDIVSLVWAHVFGTLILVTVVLCRLLGFGKGIQLPHDPLIWVSLVFFGALQALVYLLVYKGFSKGQVAVLNPVFASYSGLVALVSIIVFGELVTGSGVVALALIFCGILLLSIDRQAVHLHLASTPGFREIVLAVVCATAWTLGWDKLVSGKDWVSYALCMYAFMTAAVFAISKLQRVRLGVTNRKVWKFLVLIGVGETVAYLSISLGYSTTSLTSVIAVLSGAFSLPTIILARVFLKEKVGATQTLGSLIVVGGIVILALR